MKLLRIKAADGAQERRTARSAVSITTRTISGHGCPLLRIMALLVTSSALLLEAAQLKPTRVPPPGITFAEMDRAQLRAVTDALAQEINSLRSAKMSELLPDVEILHKAVDWALRYDEFYRSNEVGLARGLLKTGLERAKQLREGKPAWLSATGLVVRGYRSRIDGSAQPYGLVVPASFASDKIKPRRLDVWLHGRDDKLTEVKFITDRQRSYGEFAPADTFVLHPYGRYCNAFKFAGETDVFEALEHVKKSYAIDERQLALRGFSMGGAGAWHLGAHHPDVWTVVAPGAGFAETAEYTKANRASIPAWEQKLWQLYDATDYAANFANLPVIAYNGTDDPQRQAADVMERAMKAEGLTLPRVWGTNVPHKWTPEAKKEVEAFVEQQVARGKELEPSRIHFTTRTLSFNKARTIEVLALENHWQRADIDFEAGDGRDWRIATKNVSAFIIRRRVDRIPDSVLVDGQKVRGAPVFHVVSGVTFFSFRAVKQPDGNWAAMWQSAAGLSKAPQLQGPIDDAFQDSFLVVRPTGKAQNVITGRWIAARLVKATNDWRAQFRGEARVKDDTQVTDADIAAHNLVIFGDPRSNKLLARIAEKLPIKWTSQSVQVGGKPFPAATHVPVFIFPNPLNPKRYVVVNSGFTFAAAGLGSNAQQTPKLPDYAVLDVADGSVALADFFDEQWRVK